MLRFVSVFLIGVLCTFTSAMADVSLLIGNRNYQRASWMYDADKVLNVGQQLRSSGYTVVSGRNLSIDQTRAAVRGFVDRLDDAERAIIVLNGHFVHSDSDTWFVPVDAFPPNRVSVNYEALSLRVILEIIGQKPGGAAVFLGTQSRAIETSGGIKPGIGPLQIPQGVLVVTGKPADIARTLSRDFLTPGTGFAQALADAPESVSGQGFISDMVSLAPLPTGGSNAGSSEQGYWQAVNDMGTEEALRAYLQAYPQGANSAEAWNRLNALVVKTPEEMAREAEAALGLSRRGRSKIQENLSLLGYDTRGIDGIFGRGTRRAISNWQGDRDFDATGYVTQRQINRLSRQAARKADKLAEEARLKQRQLEDTDRAFWQSSGAASGDERGMRRYLRRFPDGLFADVAQVRLDAIEQAQRLNVGAQERNAWDEATRLNTIASYSTYLDHFDDGAFSDEARARLSKLQEEEAQNAQKEAAKQAEAQLNLNGFARLLVEQQLSKLGFDAGPTDGRFDKKTRRAIRRFQKARGFPVTGYLNRQTIVRLIAEAG